MAAPASDMTTDISIHAPREGSDSQPQGYYTLSVAFLSTLPARGATQAAAGSASASAISIHAPREGSDGFTDLMCKLI